MSTSFTRGENPLRADKLNTAFSERVSRGGDTMQGMLRLAGDPVVAFDAATKQYVDRILSMGAHLAAVVVADAPPPGAPDSTLWWDSSGTGLYVRYNDGSSTQWVVAENQAPAGGTVSVVNVLDHGAKGDGTTDDTTAIQGALNTYAGKATVFIPTPEVSSLWGS